MYKPTSLSEAPLVEVEQTLS